MFYDRRVHRIRLRAPAPDLIQHGAVVLEDALRTASLPGLPPNGLLLIRSLNLGRLAAGSTSASVADRIERTLRTLRVRVIDRDTPEQPHAAVVWFCDEVEPYALLAGLLARHIQPESWYWPRAVRGWSARMPPDQGVRHVLHEVSRKRAGIAAAARVVAALISGSGFEVLGRSLQPRDGDMLLALSGIHTPVDVGSAGEQWAAPSRLMQMERPWRRALENLAPQWGRRNDRTVWLAYVAVCACWGMTDPYITAGLLHEFHQMPEGRPASAADLPRGEESLRAVSAADAGPSSAFRTSGEHADATLKTRSAARQTPVSGRAPQPADYSNLFADPAASAGVRSDRMGRPEVAASDEAPGDGTHAGRLSETGSTADHLGRKVPDGLKAGGDMRPFKKSAPTASDHAAGQFLQAPRAGPQPSETFRDTDPAGIESEFAGLVFAVQTLEWLGIRDTLADHAPLAACQLPARILWHCADCLAIPHHDPICEFLADLQPVPTGASFNFTAPAAWQNYCAPSESTEKTLIMQRVRGIPHKRLLADHRTGLTFALWQGPVPAAVRSWVREHTLRRGPAAARFKDLDRIIGTWAAAMDFFLHKYAGTDLQGMAARAGKVAVTRTHLDVTFDQSRLDIGIRQAGLDIDPGWVPWLGRVVYIHYRGLKEIINV